MSTATADVHHHLYKPDQLRPFCGVIPGRDEETGTWHTGHDLDLLLQCLDYGLPACVTCLSPAALGG